VQERAVRSGNNWNNGSNLGVSNRNCNNAASNSNRNFCARTSIKSSFYTCHETPYRLVKI